jgi:hypothetical protein
LIERKGMRSAAQSLRGGAGLRAVALLHPLRGRLGAAPCRGIEIPNRSAAELDQYDSSGMP